MNFFEAQERARKSSQRLVLWFILATFGVVCSLYLVTVVFFEFTTERPPEDSIQWWDGELFLMVAPTVGGVILLGSLFKLAQLSAGGAVVARDLGGRPLDRSTTDYLERRLLNVVDEMAIASSVPAPEVWLLDDEEGINAFAAGTDPANAVIGITRGCLERLSRDELQGVVAHEFSHILNGDMKLNMRLTGWVFGLIMIAMIGRLVMRLIYYGGGSRRSKDSGGGAMAIVVAGLALWLIGSVGVFFARLLQAAVSREREYLADASAVQFTRNPDGIASALKKIGGFKDQGMIRSSGASEARHLFFATSDLVRLGFSTHPPLEKRIRAIDPNWSGELLEATKVSTEASGDPVRSRPMMNVAGASLAMGLVQGTSITNAAGDAPETQQPTLQSKEDALMLLFGLLLPPPEDESAGRALALVRAAQGERIGRGASVWQRILHQRKSAEKLALVDVALPWLRRLGNDDARKLLELNRQLIEADGEVSLFEFMLERVIGRHVAINAGLRSISPMKFRSLVDLEHESAVLLSALAYQSSNPAAFNAAAKDYFQHTQREIKRLSKPACDIPQLADALEKFEAATPLVKSQILNLCGLVAVDDGVLDDREVELLRAAADAMGAPLPTQAQRMLSEQQSSIDSANP